MELGPRAGDIVTSVEDLVFAAASAMVFLGPEAPPLPEPPPPVPTPATSPTHGGIQPSVSPLESDAMVKRPRPPGLDARVFSGVAELGDLRAAENVAPDTTTATPRESRGSGRLSPGFAIMPMAPVLPSAEVCRVVCYCDMQASPLHSEAALGALQYIMS